MLSPAHYGCCLERRLSLSPSRIVAQAVGANASSVAANISPGRNSNAAFMTRLAAAPNNSIDAYRASTLLQPTQAAQMVHRFPLAHGNTPEVQLLLKCLITYANSLAKCSLQCLLVAAFHHFENTCCLACMGRVWGYITGSDCWR